MARKPVFLSFDYKQDVFRVQQIRNIGSLEGQTLLSANDFETIKRKGDAAVQKWIDDNMKYTQCIIVIIGKDTANRPWVQYEIKKAWNEKRPMFGIYVHNLECPVNGSCQKGKNPFDILGEQVANSIRCYEPDTYSLEMLYDKTITKGKAAYNHIKRNIEEWVDTAVREKQSRSFFDTLYGR